MVSTGTATGIAMTTSTHTQVRDDRIITPRHAVDGEMLALGSIPTTGAVVEWLAGLGGDRSSAATAGLLEEAAQTECRSAGTSTVISFSGARSVRWRPEVRGAFLALELGTSRGDLARSVIEAIGLETCAVLAALNAELREPAELVLTGGLHENDFVCQVMADTTGVVATRYAERDAALSGALLLAAGHSGSDAHAFARERLGDGRHFEPDPGLAEIYEARRLRHEAAYLAALDYADPQAHS
jgi:sugar (pentulose or hexulose) kinase